MSASFVNGFYRIDGINWLGTNNMGLLDTSYDSAPANTNGISSLDANNVSVDYVFYILIDLMVLIV